MSSLSQFGGAGSTKWVSGTEYAVDQIVWSPVNYLTYIRTVAGNGTTDPSSDTANWALFGPSKIKSVQRGTIAIGSGNSSATATITAVTTSKSELRSLGMSTDQTNNLALAYVSLTNTTTVTATRTTTTGNATVSYEVVEWW